MIRLPDMRYFELHGKCAAGTLNPVERIELDALCAVKEAQFLAQQEAEHEKESGDASLL